MSCSIHPQWIHGSEDCPLCFDDKNKERLQEELATLRATVRRLQEELANAAHEINCAGPVDHRIRVLKRELDDELCALDTKRQAAEAALRTLQEERDQLAKAVLPDDDKRASWTVGNLCSLASAHRQDSETLDAEIEDAEDGSGYTLRHYIERAKAAEAALRAVQEERDALVKNFQQWEQQFPEPVYGESHALSGLSMLRDIVRKMVQ